MNKKVNLVQHLRTHTRERPYRCSVTNCGAQYACNKAFKNHMNSVHSSEQLNESKNASKNARGGE